MNSRRKRLKNDKLRQDLEKEKIKSKNYFELSPNLTVILNNDGNIVDINKSGCEILEVDDKNNIIGKSWFDLFLPKNLRNDYREKLSRIVSDKNYDINADFPTGHVNDVVTQTKKIKTIEWFNSVLRDSSGKIKYCYSTGIDITEKIFFEEQLQQAAKLEAIGRLAGGIAHDFNNMLTVINGFSDLLIKQFLEKNCDCDSQDVIIKLGKIKSSAKRASTLTKQLLAFGRKQVLKPDVQNVNQIIEEDEELYQRLIRENIEIHYRLANIGNIYVDKIQFQNIIINLIINSRDAINGIGNIIIETKDVNFNKKHRDIVPGNYVLISITDNGCGMTLDTKKKVFEPFFTTKQIGQGIGLGLSTVYGVIKQSNGHIWIDSTPNIGTTFNLYFPRVNEKCVEKCKQTIDKKKNKVIGGTETILLVEDEQQVNDLMKEILTKYGYNVHVAYNGIDALKVADKSQIDLLITDVIMPEMDGHTLGLQLLQKIPDLKVLYMSGYTNDIIINDKVEVGIEFIQKPISTTLLLSTIRELINNWNFIIIILYNIVQSLYN